jgi:hypothetical protein
MAYIDQTKKQSLAPGIKAVLKKYGMKGTLGIRHHSTLVVNVSQGPLDIISNMYEIALTRPDSHYAREKAPKPTQLQVNEHWIEENYSGKAREFLRELKAAMKGPDWRDNSDIQTDHFDISWYLDINIGQWNRPFLCTA